jgi:hypothetical protein
MWENPDWPAAACWQELAGTPGTPDSSNDNVERQDQHNVKVIHLPK